MAIGTSNVQLSDLPSYITLRYSPLRGAAEIMPKAAFSQPDGGAWYRFTTVIMPVVNLSIALVVNVLIMSAMYHDGDDC